LPYLRFTRDKRGYETTALVHAYSGRQGRARQKVLYWFRSPPNVKVGRPALDQDAIRWVEEHNPDIEFDWPQILQATAPPAPPADDARGRRTRRGRTDRPAPAQRPDRRAPQRAASAPPSPPRQEPIVTDAPPPPVLAAPVEPPAAPDVAEAPFIPSEELGFTEEAVEQLTHPDTDEAPPPPVSAVETVLGREQLIRFRARYAELQARIIERGGEPARVEELRAQAEPLNPDSWVTVEEARQGLEAFEPKIRELRAAMGLKRRRRSRRGGRRRRGAPVALDASVSQTDPAAPASNASAVAAADDAAEAGPAEDDGDEG
jgi:hypothetical protein